MISNDPVTPEEAIRNLPNFFSFKSIGRGYCPVTEVVKTTSIPIMREPAELKSALIQGRHFLIPTYLTTTDNLNGHRFRRVSFENQEFYQKNKAVEYGLSGVNLVVRGVTSEGRWENYEGTLVQQAYVNSIHETHLSLVTIENPLEHLSVEFRERLENLPTSSIGFKQCFKFHEFFTDYGTHLIVQQSLGGEILYTCKLNGTDFTESWGVSFSNRIGGMFEQIVHGQLGGEYSNGGSLTRGVETQEEEFFTHGGQPPATHNELTPEIFADWKLTIPDNMIELKHGFKLVPYYELLPGSSARAAAMKEATLRYLENTLPSRTTIRTEILEEERCRSRKQTEKEKWTFAVKVVGGLALIAAGLGANILLRK